MLAGPAGLISTALPTHSNEQSGFNVAFNFNTSKTDALSATRPHLLSKSSSYFAVKPSDSTSLRFGYALLSLVATEKLLVAHTDTPLDCASAMDVAG